jgi:hypothetical protein
MNDLVMDAGAELHISIGNVEGFNGEMTDMIDVNLLNLHGDLNIFVEKRCGQHYTPGCYPIINYMVSPTSNLNNLKLATLWLDGYPLSLDTSQPGLVQLCVGTFSPPIVRRAVILPDAPPGGTITPAPGIHYVPWGTNFNFTINYMDREELEVYSDRLTEERDFEMLIGKINANGEHEYTLTAVKTQPITIYIGRKPITRNENTEGASVWSNGNTLFVRVVREDIASVYSVAGNLVNRIEVPEGGISVPLARGAYIVTLKDGSVHKVIIR